MPEPRLSPGTLLGHYRIHSLVGEGGMGQVYRAQDTRLERDVALKVLPSAFARDPHRMRRFTQEAKAASALNHPNVAHIYDIGESDGFHFLAMEFVKGETLEATLSSSPLPLTETLSIAIDLADALDAAHSAGVTHRDIKPANIIVTSRGHAKVLDFGIARIHSVSDETAEMRLTAVGSIMGTVDYMSPEQALGRDVDGRSDLFSVGVVLYRMATGRLPFSAASPQETLARILQTPPEPIARYNHDVPEGLERVIRKCLEKDRERRYQSARALVIDLQNLRGSEAPGQARAASVLRVVIVDDEELARQLLREYLTSCADVEIAAECANGFEAVKAIGQCKPDLVFT